MTDYLFKPLTDDQRKLVDRLTKNMDQAFFMEKRETERDFQPGILLPVQTRGQPLRVMVSEEDYRVDGRVLLCASEFPTINPVELICDFRDRKVRLRGRVEATRPGRRESDRAHKPPLHISVFHPKRV